MDALTTADSKQLLDIRHAHVHGQPYGSCHAVGCKASTSWHAVRRVPADRDGGLSIDPPRRHRHEPHDAHIARSLYGVLCTVHDTAEAHGAVHEVCKTAPLLITAGVQLLGSADLGTCGST